jgi:hypothetical protein
VRDKTDSAINRTVGLFETQMDHLIRDEEMMYNYETERIGRRTTKAENKFKGEGYTVG